MVTASCLLRAMVSTARRPSQESGLLGLLMEPYLLEGIFEQRLPGHVDLYVTGECVGLKTKTIPWHHVSSEEALCTDGTTC